MNIVSNTGQKLLIRNYIHNDFIIILILIHIPIPPVCIYPCYFPSISFHFIVPYDPPVTLQVAAQNASAISLTWSPPLIPYGNIVSYTILVEYGIVGGNVTTLVVNSSLGTNYSVTNLLPFTYYNFSVAASTRIGMGPFSTISTRTPQDSKN